MGLRDTHFSCLGEDSLPLLPRKAGPTNGSPRPRSRIKPGALAPRERGRAGGDRPGVADQRRRLRRSAEGPASVNPLAPRPPDVRRPRRSGSSTCHLTGSPPHLDLFDYKPELVKHDGEPCPDSFLKGKAVRVHLGRPQAAGHPHGSSPSTARTASGCQRRPAPLAEVVADDLCVIRSMHTDQFNHAPAELLLYTGSPRSGRPSMGTWVTYGLGTRRTRTCRASSC